MEAHSHQVKRLGMFLIIFEILSHYFEVSHENDLQDLFFPHRIGRNKFPYPRDIN